MEKIGNSQGTKVACRYLRIVGLPGVGLAGFYCNFLFLIMREKNPLSRNTRNCSACKRQNIIPL